MTTVKIVMAVGVAVLVWYHWPRPRPDPWEDGSARLA